MPGVERVNPILHGGALVFADFVQVVQRQARIKQRAPVVKSGAGVDQLALPMVQLTRQLAAQVQIAIDHHANHAQHQIGRIGRYAPRRVVGPAV
jgi:hypothetical protein